MKHLQTSPPRSSLLHSIACLILFVVSVLPTGSSQIAFFANPDCGVTQQITSNCPTITWVSIPVSGIGNLGQGNYGIDGVGVELSQAAGFACNIFLKAPNDSIYLLSSGEEGFSDFPNYGNGTLNVEFKGCPNLPFPAANVSQPSGKSFQPYDDFTELNELGISGSGNWQVGFCGLPDDINVNCVNLTFNTLCPEVVAVNVTDLSCDGANDGIIELIVDGGTCSPTYYSLNEGPVTTIARWEGLTTGNFNIHISNYLTAERNRSLSICDQDIQVEVLVNDLTPPTIVCPADQTVHIPQTANNDTCQWVAPVTFEVPTFSDNCGITAAQMDYYLDDNFWGTSDRYTGESGTVINNYVYQYGVSRFVYRVFDANQSRECTFYITVLDTVPPVWWEKNTDTLLSFECNTNNYNIGDSLQAWARKYRLCENDFTSYTLVDHQQVCGYTYRDLFEVTLYDPSGNENLEKRHVTVILEDTTPPILTGVPAEYFISYCGSTIDGLPEIGTDIIAFDSCAGDVTDRIQEDIYINLYRCEQPDTLGVYEERIYTYTVADDCGNTSIQSYRIYIIDTTAPVLTGMIPDVTITCNQDMPPLPAITAYDGCSGDVSDRITLASSVQQGDCVTGSVAEILQYSWDVTDYCGNSAHFDWTVTVMNNFSIDLGSDVSICSGDTAFLNAGTTGNTYLWSTGATTAVIGVTASGMYAVTVTSANGCCAKDSVRVELLPLPIVTASTDTITCSHLSAELWGFSDAPNSSFSWSGPGGFRSSTQNALAMTPGTYDLTVTSPAGCVMTTSVQVTIDTVGPAFQLMDDTLTCIKDSLRLFVSPVVSDFTYQWNGPDNFQSTELNPWTRIPGSYTLEVSAPNGCTTAASLQIVSDQVAPAYQLKDDTLTCTKDSLRLFVSPVVSDYTYQWDGPENFHSSELNPWTKLSGSYTLEVTAPNGCSTVKQLIISEDKIHPTVDFKNDTLTCELDSLQLSIQVDREDYHYSWTGPGGFSSNRMHPWITEVGTYRGFIQAENGCTSIVDLQVIADQSLPKFSVSPDTLNCLQDSIQLTINTTQSDLSYQWYYADTVVFLDPDPWVSLPGKYGVKVTGSNGCSSIANLVITQDTVAPLLNIIPGMVDCEAQTQLLTALSNRNPGTYLWSGPNNFSSSNSEIEINQDGKYEVLFTGPNGCTGSYAYQALVSRPESTIAGDTVLSCTINSVLLTGISADAIRYQWTGPDGFSADEITIKASVPGMYSLIVSNFEDCSDTSFVSVVQNMEVPDLTAIGGVLPCDPGTLQLAATSAAGTSFVWSGPDNFTSTETNPMVSQSGSYTVEVMDAEGCTASKIVLVQAPPVILATITTAMHPNGDMADASIFISSGTGPFQVVWDNGDTSFTTIDLTLDTHYVEVTDVYGCTEQFEFVIDASTAIEDISFVQNWIAYPNPSDQYLQIDVEFTSSQESMVSLIDLHGRPVWQHNYTERHVGEQIPVSHLPGGLYLIKITTNRGSTAKPVMILH